MGQPFRRWTTGGSFLANAISDPKIKRLLIMTAWVRSGGLESLLPSLEDLRARGGRAELIVGVDLMGTSRQGLELAQRWFDTVHVVHDPEGRTFHPKAYLALGRDRGYALIGSNNLTAGGLGYNYEAAMACTFAPAEAPALVSDIHTLRRTLIADKAICKKLSASTMKVLIDDWLADEDTERRFRDEDGLAKRRSKPSRGKPLFERSKVAKRRSTTPARHRGAKTRPRGVDAKLARAPDTWWKRLGQGDAQRPPRGKRTGVIRLTPPRHVADRNRFFRSVFFKDAHWRRRRDANENWLQVAAIEVDAWFDGTELGSKQLTVDYGPHRNKRGRATTVLHWEDLLPLAHEHDLKDKFVIIERGPGAYRLRIESTEPI